MSKLNKKLEQEFRQALQEGSPKIKEVLDQIEPAVQKILDQAAEIAEHYGIPFEYISGLEDGQERKIYTPKSWKEKFGEFTWEELEELEYEKSLDFVYPRDDVGWQSSLVCY